MKIAFFTSNKGGSPLIGGLERGMMSLGHQVHVYRPGEGYDLIVICNQVAHDADYVYPEFPLGNTPIAFLDSAEFGYHTRLPDRRHLYANTFTEAAMAHDTKNRGQQERLRRFLEGRSFPYFLREYMKGIDYPESYHPIDYPLYHLSECPKAPNRNEYLSRDLDLFLAWGHSHPWRPLIEQELRNCHTKCEIFKRDMGAGVNMPQDEYFRRQEAAKVGVSFDGYGSGSFRMTEVLVRSCLLMGPLGIVTRAPLKQGVTCLGYGVRNEGEQFICSSIATALECALRDREGAFEIYEAGYHHCMTHLTERATAQYVIETVERHDWGKATELTICQQ